MNKDELPGLTEETFEFVPERISGNEAIELVADWLGSLAVSDREALSGALSHLLSFRVRPIEFEKHKGIDLELVLCRGFDRNAGRFAARPKEKNLAISREGQCISAAERTGSHQGFIRNPECHHLGFHNAREYSPGFLHLFFELRHHVG
jgi:hypothetical protein